MGLSFYVQKAEPAGIGFSYFGFHEFRHRIARSCGFHDCFPGTDTDFYKNDRWKEMEETHPMYSLLSHSDCDGNLHPDDCYLIATHFEIILQEWRTELAKNRDIDLENDIDMAEQLAKVMMQCYRHGETLLFM